MGFLDKGVDLADFESFKLDVNTKLKNLSDEIKVKASDSEVSARESAESSLVLLNKIRAIKGEVDSALSELISYKESAKVELSGVKALAVSSQEFSSKISTLADANEKICSSTVEQQKTVSKVFAEINAELAVVRVAVLEAQKLPEQMESAKKLLEGAGVVSKDIEGLLTHAMKKKSDIDELHKIILGADVKGADGTIERVDGLLDELKSVYGSLKSQADTLEKQIEKAVEDVTDKHDVNLSQNKTQFEELLETSRNRYSAINDEITGLLPGAMAAGLSAAYERKKDDEASSLVSHEVSFRIAIALMVLVSLIPFGVDVFLLSWKGSDLVEVIKSTPNLIVSILPLYFPVLWFAYSSSKKLNLSKRLIEEYTHKAVLGRTFSGLSNQIESLPRESVVRDELRTRLLFNMLQVSSENPGKLITDYNKSDHPLMDALENSAKLSDSVESLSKLPGFSALAKKLASRTEELVSAQAQRVKDGLATQEELEKIIPEENIYTAQAATEK